MNMNRGEVQLASRVAGLFGACAFILGAIGFGAAASSPNPRRDVSMDYSAEVGAPALADRTLVADAQSDLKKDESFTNETKVVEYRFRLDNSSDMVHLDVTAEIKHGLLRWELVDPTGEVRARIGTTEHASMDTTDIQAIKGEWLLRMTLQDATGRYHVSWVR